MAYINREKAIAYVEEQYRLFDNNESKQAVVEGCVEALKFTPTADVVEVKHAEWEISSDGYYPYCTNCRYEPPWVGGKDMRTPYCPNCGAKMDGGKAE